MEGFYMQGKRIIRKTEGLTETNNSSPVKMTNEKRKLFSKYRFN